MIKTFDNKQLKALWETGKSKIDARFHARILRRLSTAEQNWTKGQRKMLPLWGCDNQRPDERQHPGGRACHIAGGCPDALARQGQSVRIEV